MSKQLKNAFIKKAKKLNSMISKTENSIRNLSMKPTKEEIKYFNLPPIEKHLYQQAILQPTSVLTRYLEEHTQNFLKNEAEELNKPIIIKPQRKRFNFEDNDNNILVEEEKKKTNKVCITEADEKLDKKSVYLTETNKEVPNSASHKESSKHSSSKKVTEIKNETPNNDVIVKKKGIIPESIRVNEELPLEKIKKLEKYFRRIKSYQPHIFTNWKARSGLSVSVGKMGSPSPIINDIEYQSKIFRDQAKLLEDNILHYKMNIITRPNYIESFKSLPLNSKIKYNKALEETIGIILLLPQLILLDFYKYIQKFENISVPKNTNFEDKYIFDEIENLYFNNNLLSEVLEFFLNCFDVYLFLIEEVDDMNLKPKNYNNVITSFEKARFNMCYVINSTENAIANYNKDIRSINKFNKGLGIINNYNKKNLSEKIMNQFLFKKNAERQRRMRIEACLNYQKDEEKAHNISKSYFKRIGHAPKIKSVIDSELINKLLKNCVGEAKLRITTERINNEIEGGLGEDGQNLKFSKRQVIKLNF